MCVSVGLACCNRIVELIYSVHGCIIICGLWVYKGFSNKGNPKSDKEPDGTLVYKDPTFTISSLLQVVGPLSILLWY